MLHEKVCAPQVYLLQALREALTDRLVLAVTHRLSTIAHADSHYRRFVNLALEQAGRWRPLARALRSELPAQEASTLPGPPSTSTSTPKLAAQYA